MTPKKQQRWTARNARRPCGSAANQRQQQQLHMQKTPNLLSSCLAACFGLVLLLGLLELLLGLLELLLGVL